MGDSLAVFYCRVERVCGAEHVRVDYLVLSFSGTAFELHSLILC